MQHLQGKKVILHTDGAKTYHMAIDGVIHDNVTHLRKQVLINGKKVWPCGFDRSMSR